MIRPCVMHENRPANTPECGAPLSPIPHPMKIDSSILYMPCPCGSGSKFKFCCWPKYRDQLDGDMPRAEIVQTVRCEKAGVYSRSRRNPEAAQLSDQGHDALMDDTDVDAAKELFRRAREIDPHDDAAWNNGAVCSYESGDVEEACEVQRQGIDAAPYRNTFGMASMAIYLHLLGRDDESASWIDRALEDKLPLSRDVVTQVCKALALFRRHREILDYASASCMDDDENVAFFKATALANLGETGKALPIFRSIGNVSYGPLAERYADLIEDGDTPASAYEGDWPYFESRAFPPARWFDNDLSDGLDPFARYPSAAVDAMEVLVSDGLRSPRELLNLIKDRPGDRIAKFREGLESFEKNGAEGSWTVDEDGGKPFRLPPGVTALSDSTKTGFPMNKPKWRMLLDLSENEEDAAVEADKVVNGLVVPYFERYCSFGDLDTGPQTEIALLQSYEYQGSGPIATCPGVLMGQYRHLWAMLLDRLEEYFENCSLDPCVCEVRQDRMYGGPILSISQGPSVSTFLVAHADQFASGGR